MPKVPLRQPANTQCETRTWTWRAGVCTCHTLLTRRTRYNRNTGRQANTPSVRHVTECLFWSVGRSSSRPVGQAIVWLTRARLQCTNKIFNKHLTHKNILTTPSAEGRGQRKMKRPAKHMEGWLVVRPVWLFVALTGVQQKEAKKRCIKRPTIDGNERRKKTTANMYDTSLPTN